MNGTSVITYLRELCDDMDAGRPLKRFLWTPGLGALVVAGALGAGCVGSCGPDDAPPVPAYAAPEPISVAPPSNAEYAAPAPEPYREPVEPLPVPEYGAPPGAR